MGGPLPKEWSDLFACLPSPAFPREFRLREHPRVADVRIQLRACRFVKRPGAHACKPRAFFAAAKTFPCFVLNSTPPIVMCDVGVSSAWQGEGCTPRRMMSDT